MKALPTEVNVNLSSALAMIVLVCWVPSAQSLLHVLTLVSLHVRNVLICRRLVLVVVRMRMRMMIMMVSWWW